MKINLRTAFYALSCLGGLILLIYYGQPVLISLVIALLMAFILYPVCKRLEHWGFGRITATIVSLFSVVAIIFGIFYLFSTQIISLISEFSDFEQKLTMLSEKVITFFNRNIPLVPDIEKSELIDKSQEWVKKSGGELVSGTFKRTAAIISGISMVIVYTFLLLIYRSGLKKVAMEASHSKQQDNIAQMIDEMQRVGQQYILGMSIMVLILGSANSLALFLLGIEHALFFGFMAGLLSVIPYIGTTIGATIPVLYTFMTEDSWLVPLGVIITFWFIQLIESNFLSPKIVGGNLNINALAAILSLIIGGYIWGIAGMALFLPMSAIVKVFCGYFDQLRPISLLLGAELYTAPKSKVLNRIKDNLKKTILKK